MTEMLGNPAAGHCLWDKGLWEPRLETEVVILYCMLGVNTQCFSVENYGNGEWNDTM